MSGCHLWHCSPVDFADPGVFWDDERQLYFGYGTNANGFNVPCCSSPDFCSWQLAEHDALPGPYPPWTGKDGFRCWAPEVRRAPEGRPGYLMYFSTHDFRTGVMSIAVAYSPRSPLGPFAFVGDGPLVSQVRCCAWLRPLSRCQTDAQSRTYRETWVERLTHSRLRIP